MVPEDHSPQAAQPVVHVAVAVIRDDQGRVLVARRPSDKHMGGYWEFPGGKVEPGEPIDKALARELEEELAIKAGHFKPLIKIRHDYPGKSVLLDTWWASVISGTARGNEGQEIQWVDLPKLGELEFPPANTSILNAALLPTRYMVTGLFSSSAELLEKVSLQLDQGIQLVQFRAPWLQERPYFHLARELHHLCQPYGAKLLLKGGPALLEETWCDGIHLRSDQLTEKSLDWKKSRRPGQWLGASCHNQQQLDQALEAGVDFVTLSPVRPTKSHPGRLALGIEEAKKLLDDYPLPVYWLGGLGVNDEALAIESGAQGIAAIGAFWT